MSFRDDLRPASFRGVPFSVTTSDRKGGRRLAQHEYPLRDTPYAEDLGRKQRQFTVEAHVLGDDCLKQRDALIDALEQEGPGQLVHPFYGTLQVTAGEYSVGESSTESRIARITIPFFEAGERKFPAASADFVSRLGIAGDGVFSSSSSWFSSVFSVAALPQKYIARAVAQVQSLGSRLQGIGSIVQTATSFYSTAHNLVTEAVNLVSAPANLASNIIGAVGAISNLRFDWGSISEAYTALASVGASAEALTAYTPTDADGQTEVAETLFEFGDPSRGEDAFSEPPTAVLATSTRQREQQNTEALVVLVRTAAVVVAAKAAAERDYPTYESAIEQRTDLCEEIDELSESVDDATYQSLQDLKVALTNAVPAEGENLPSLKTIRNKVARPSLVVAYDLYESLDLEADIIARNHVEHPGFVPAGVDLEVICG